MFDKLNQKLPIWALFGPFLLILLYGLLCFVALTNQACFYEAMSMPTPNHGFMHISWTGKTIAIWIILILATLSRNALPLTMALIAVVIQQIGDFIAGSQTNVEVAVTKMGFALWTVSMIVIFIALRKQKS